MAETVFGALSAYSSTSMEPIRVWIRMRGFLLLSDVQHESTMIKIARSERYNIRSCIKFNLTSSRLNKTTKQEKEYFQFLTASKEWISSRLSLSLTGS